MPLKFGCYSQSLRGVLFFQMILYVIGSADKFSQKRCARNNIIVNRLHVFHYFLYFIHLNEVSAVFINVFNKRHNVLFKHCKLVRQLRIEYIIRLFLIRIYPPEFASAYRLPHRQCILYARSSELVVTHYAAYESARCRRYWSMVINIYM